MKEVAYLSGKKEEFYRIDLECDKLYITLC